MNRPTMDFSPPPLSWSCALHGDYPSAVDDGSRPQYNCPTCTRGINDARTAWHAAWRLYTRWKASGIPSRYLNRTFDNYRSSTANKQPAAIARNYAERFPEQYAQGTGLLLTGGLGTGKTHLAVATLTWVIRSGWAGAFIAITDLLAAKKPGYSGHLTNTARFETVDLLVLDDVGATRGTDWEVSILADLLNTRYDTLRPTIVTTNAPDLAAFVGDRAIDRFTESMLTTRLIGESYRSKVPDDEALRTAPVAIAEPSMEFNAEFCAMGKMRTARYRMTDRGEEKIA